MTALPAASELATVETGDKAVVFQLKPSDVLWTARAAAREAAREAPITTWVFTQRAVYYMLKSPGISYTAVLRGFSQPINPIWAADGEKCRPGGPYAGKPECSPERLVARKWYTNATWAQLDAKHPDVTAVVAKWARGQLQNPVPRVMNFAAPKVAQNHLDNTPGAQLFYKGDNWYIIDPPADSWPDTYVRMISPDGAIATAQPLRSSTVFAAILKGAAEWWRIG